MLDVLFALLRVMVMSTCRHILLMERADRVAQTAEVVWRLCEKRKKGDDFRQRSNLSLYAC